MVALVKERVTRATRRVAMEGKGDWNNHGQGQGGSGGFQGTCDYCHKYGHKKRDCYKLDNEKGNGKGQYVRQVEGADECESSEAGSSPSTSYRSSSDGGASTTAGGKPSVKLLTQATIIEDEEDYEIDLTYVGGAGGAVCALSFADEKVVTEVDIEHKEVLHVRAMNFDDDKLEEIVFDSGADVSALPLRFSHAGTPGYVNRNKYVDAQGNQIPVNGTRLAKVQFGKITFKENFILSPVTTPLISLGHLLRDGWGISNEDGRQWLVEGDLGIPVELRGNSLVGKGRICVVQAGMKEKQHFEKAEEKKDGRVHALVLLPALQNLEPGWNRINEDLWAMKSRTLEYQDTTLVPADTMLWFRSTLLKIDGRWQLEEDSQDVTLMDRRDALRLQKCSPLLTTFGHDEEDG